MRINELRREIRLPSFKLMVYMAKHKVFDPGAQIELVKHQKMLLDLGMEKAIVITGPLDPLKKAQLRKAAEESGNTVEIQFESIEEACQYAGIPYFDFHTLTVSGEKKDEGIRELTVSEEVAKEINAQIGVLNLLTDDIAEAGKLYFSAVSDGDDGAMVGSKLVNPKQVDHSIDALTQAAQSHVEEKVHLQSENKSVEGGFFMELIFLIH